MVTTGTYHLFVSIVRVVTIGIFIVDLKLSKISMANDLHSNINVDEMEEFFTQNTCKNDLQLFKKVCKRK